MIILKMNEHTDFTINNLEKVINKYENKGINLTKLKNYIKNGIFDKRVVFIGGSQISGSLSPIIHTFSSLELLNEEKKFLYTLLNLEQEKDIKTKEILNYIEKNDDILGANVTMPYKIEVFDLLEKEKKLDESALLVGAVNTISKQNGEIKGYNTDFQGIIGPIISKLSLEKLKILKNGYILGSGGAAQATIVALLELGITNITIFNRKDITKLINHFNSEKIQKILKNKYGNNFVFKINYVNYDVTRGDKISDFIKNKGILVNTLPFGFKPDLPKKSILDSELEKIKDNTLLFFDVVYDMNYLDTPLLEDFKKLNIPTCDGRDMLIGQALKGFELWTNGSQIDKEKINKLLR